MLARLTAVLVLSNSADQFAQLALVWFVLQQTGSPLAVGAVIVCASMSALLTAPWIGVLLDRRRPQTLIALDNALRAGCLLSIPLLHWAGLLTLPLTLGAATLAGMLSPVTYAGTRVLVPRLTDDHRLAGANAKLGIGDQIPYLLGPATAGIAVARIGGPVSMLIPTAALATAAVLILGVRVRPACTDQGPAEHHTISGLTVIRRDPMLRALIALTVAYYFAYGPLESALPVYVRSRLHAGAGLYGGMWAVFGAGALVGLLTVSRLARLRPGVVNAAGAIGWGALIAPMALVYDPVPAAALLFAGAFVWAPYTALEMSVIQKTVPHASLGAVIGTRRALLVAASPAGAALGGVCTTPRSAPYVIAASALACVFAGALALRSRPLRAVPPPATHPPPPPGERPLARPH